MPALKKILLLFCCVLTCMLQLIAQGTPPYSILYDDTMVNRIYITMAADSLEEMYDVLENEHEYAVQFVYDRGTQQDTLQEVGFRLRGNTSLFSAKKSFKVSFNTYNPGRTFEGAKKLNLIGNHNDPTMAREKIYFDIYNYMGLPVRRVAFAEVYINGDYFGLYTVVEEYDDIWLRDRYGDDSGVLLKCIYGSTLQYNGTNTASYPTYEQQNHEQINMKDELVLLTDILNNTTLAELPCALEPIFDIDQFLRIYALDISTGHWDNYGANQNNYFLYRDAITGQFKFLSYDCDNVLGVDWLGIDWADRDVYDWNFDGRPMVERLLQIDAYRDRFSVYLREIAEVYMDTDYWFPRIDAIRDLIAPSALLDEYRTYDYGYSYADFLNGFDTDDIDGHCPYGIKNFIALRNANTLDQTEITGMAPAAHFPESQPIFLQSGVPAQWTVQTHDDAEVSGVVWYYSNDNITFTSLTFYDDGAHGDGVAGDAIFGNTMTPGTTDMLYYYAEATDNVGNITRVPVCGALQRPVGFTAPSLVINEIMPNNNVTIPDADGEFPDYIELYNSGIFSIYVGDFFLSDDPQRPTKWRMPDMLLPPDSYLLLFADNETEQGPNHVDFTLDAGQDEVMIYSDVLTGYSVIDSTHFVDVPADTAWGRLPNGTGPFVFLHTPSPGAYNAPPEEPAPLTFTVLLTSNPGTTTSGLQITLAEQQTVSLVIYSADGREVFREPAAELPAGAYSYEIPAYRLGSGNYYIRLQHGDGQTVLPYCVL